jgi:hypothetical protein
LTSAFKCIQKKKMVRTRYWDAEQDYKHRPVICGLGVPNTK